jgi:hypothetical protein
MASSEIDRFFDEIDDEIDPEPRTTLTEVIRLLGQQHFTDFMRHEPMARIYAETAYRAPKDSLEARQYLDYTLVKTKKLDLRSIRKRSTPQPKIKIYSRSYARRFPNKFFSEFDLRSHTFYFGKYGTSDIYIICKPTTNNFDEENHYDCACDTQRDSVPECVADIIMHEIFLKALEK